MDAKQKIMMMLDGMDGRQAAEALQTSASILPHQIKETRGKVRRELEAELDVVRNLMATT